MNSLKRKNKIKNEKKNEKKNKKNIKRKLIFNDFSYPYNYINLINNSNNNYIIGFFCSKDYKFIAKLYTIITDPSHDISDVVLYSLNFKKWYGINDLYIKGKQKAASNPSINKIRIISKKNENLELNFIQTNLNIGKWYELNDSYEIWNLYQLYPKYFESEALGDKVYFGVDFNGKFLWKINKHILPLSDEWNNKCSLTKTWSGIKYLK